MATTFNTRRFVTLLSTFILSTTIAAASFGQTPDNYPSTPPGPFHQPVPTNPVEQGFSQDHSSTAAEGFLRGKAQVIQAQGNFLLSESQAEILQEQARWLDRENDLKQTEALLAQQKMWSDARLRNRLEQNARRAAGLQLAGFRQATVLRETYQLSSQELDSRSGAICWPTILNEMRFETERRQIEHLVQQQLAYGDPQATTSTEINRSIDRWNETLRREMDSLPRTEYLAARKFLTGLKYSAASFTATVAKTPRTEALANQ